MEKSCKSFPLFFLNFVFYKVVFILFSVHECFASIKLDHIVYWHLDMVACFCSIFPSKRKDKCLFYFLLLYSF